MTYAYLGQAAQCPESTVLPPNYLDGDDVAYLPGVAPREPEEPIKEPLSVVVPLMVGGIIVFLLWKLL